MQIWSGGTQMSTYAGTEGSHASGAGGQQSQPGDKSRRALMGLTLLWVPPEQGQDGRGGGPAREKGGL